MIEPGKILQQRYRIDKQIGLGGMGAVYVATDERFGSTVAIKETLCMDDNYRKALEREARLLNSLKHVALPRVSDHFIEDNGQFLVMEFIPGNDLAVILEQTNEPFPFEKVNRWAHELLDALEFLHTQSLPVIHRDIKPQNLKLTSKEQIVLLDFGLAKGNPTDAGFQTAAKSIFGYSRNYASLEQIQGTGTDPRSDLYSLAATLYHLATGQVPEDALTRAMAVLSSKPDPLVPASMLNDSVPAGFAGVLHKALDLNADLRPASAREMREMLAEMDAYAHLAAAAGATATTPNADLGSQKTRLMPGKTDQGRENQAGMKTEVLPEYISEQTAVRVTGPRSAAAAAESSEVPDRHPLRRVAFAASGLMILLCALAAGAYVLNPSMFSHKPRVAPEPEPALPVAEQPPAAVAETSNEAAVPESPAGQASSAPREQKPETERAQGKQPSKGPGTRAAAENEPDDPDLDEDIGETTVHVGNMKIRTIGKGESANVVIEENVASPKAPRPPQLGPEFMRSMRQLPPAQRRRVLQRMRENGLLPPESPAQPKIKN